MSATLTPLGQPAHRRRDLDRCHLGAASPERPQTGRVDKRSIVPGGHYALRERGRQGLQHVRVLGLVRSGRWRAEWVDPNPGLVDFVRSRDLLVGWDGVEDLLRDERSAELLTHAVSISDYPGVDDPVDGAVNAVLESTGEPSIHLYKGLLDFDADALSRVATRAGVPLPSHPAGYEDRHGRHHLPWGCALDLAVAFARAEPSTALGPVDAQEREWSRSRSLGEPNVSALLVKYRAVWAIVRQWAGDDAAVARRDRRIADLEDLLTSVMWELRRPNVHAVRIANRIERALGRT